MKKYSFVVASALVLQVFALTATVREGLDDMVQGTKKVVRAPFHEETRAEQKARERRERKEERKRTREEREREYSRSKRHEEGSAREGLEDIGSGAGEVIRSTADAITAPFED